MSKEFEELQKHTDHHKRSYTERDAMCDEIEDIFLLNWDEQGKYERQQENAKITLSPEARNQALGAIRLLTAADPEFTVPIDQNNPEAISYSDDLEKAADIMWQAAGRVAGDPIHYDVVRSGILFSEIHIGITSTKELAEFAKGNDSKAYQRRMEEIAKQAPYLFQVYDPRTCYPEYDSFGLNAMYREYTSTAGKVINEFGERAKSVIKIDDQKRTIWSPVTVCSWYDMSKRVVWIKGEDEPILDMEHELPFIPFVSQIVEGSKLFEQTEGRRSSPEFDYATTQPFLYTLWKSGLWKRMNLLYTVWFTNMFSMGANPIWIHRQGTEGAEVERRFDIPGGSWEVEPGGELVPVITQGILDPSMVEALNRMDSLVTESTIFKQTLGEPLGANAPYSMVALLSQAGRLPLTMTQRKASWAIADAVRIAIEWLKDRGTPEDIGYGGKVVTLDPATIPDEFEIQALLDISMPYDVRESAQLAQLLTIGGDPVVSKRWARENLLKIGQSEEMTKEIWTERGQQMQFDKEAMQFYQELEMMKQQFEMQKMAAMQPQAGGMPPGGMPPEGMSPGEIPGMPYGEELAPPYGGPTPGPESLSPQEVVAQMGLIDQGGGEERPAPFPRVRPVSPPRKPPAPEE